MSGRLERGMCVHAFRHKKGGSERRVRVQVFRHNKGLVQEKHHARLAYGDPDIQALSPKP
jgi:hypothetical protein